MKLSIVPIAKPRQTQSDKWKQRPAVMAYRAYCDELNYALPCYELPGELKITFGIPMPASWSARKREAMRMQPHRVRPDIDNLAKGFMDAFKSEDSHVYRLDATKYWHDTGFILLPDYVKESR